MAGCTLDREWFLYIAVSLVTFFGGLVFIIPGRIIWYVCYRRRAEEHYEKYQLMRERGIRGCCGRIRAGLVNLVNGGNTCSRAVMVFFWLVNMASIILYLVDATLFSVEDCGPFRSDPSQLTWLVFACIFTLHYILRMVAAPDKLMAWLDIYSLVDHLTIPHIFLGFYLDKHWIGLKFLRMMYMLQIAEFLEILSLIKTRSRIRLVQVLSIFICCWFVSSGFVFLAENNGDPFHNWSNPHYLTFWSCVYWLLVTMSTVGFGEISPGTDIGRAFMVLFIIGSFAMFTSIIPELARSFGRSTKYTKPYKRVYGKTHVVVCGSITYDTICTFIKNFIHEDSGVKDTDIVFLDNTKPKLEMEAFFRRHFADVHFIQGSVMDLHSLQMVKLRDADACLIMADRTSEDENEADAANIMRATAIKNYHPNTRIIIQLLQQKNKSLLLQIPSWSWGRPHGDEVICLSELKLGILAQNCLAPGVATLISNLFTNRSLSCREGSEWERQYKYGCGHEIYVEPLSAAFTGMTFRQAAEICFAEMNVLLLGVDVGSGLRKSRLLLNPGNSFVLQADMSAYMFAQSPDSARRVAMYQAGSQRASGGLAKETNGALLIQNNNTVVSIEGPNENNAGDYHHGIGYKLAHYGERSPDPYQRDSGPSSELFDFTGLYHWCAPRTLEEATLEHDSEHLLRLSGHVLLCLLADASAPAEEIINFVMPLRASNLPRDELKDIVIVGVLDEELWASLATFSGVYFFQGSASSRSDLRLVQIERAAMCVILSSSQHLKVDDFAVDKDAVLATLNIRNLFSESLEEKIRRLDSLTSPADFRQQTAVRGEIPYITELELDNNVAFLEQDDDDDPATPLYLTLPYTTAACFATSVLDSLVSCAYLSGEVLTLARALITGVESAEFEQVVAEGLGLAGRAKPRSSSSLRDRCHLAQYGLVSGPLEMLEHGNCYGELFNLALRRYGFLCLGLYRLLDPMEKDPRRRRRYVITHPQYHCQLLATDRVFVLRPFEHHSEAPGMSEPRPDSPSPSLRSRSRSVNSSKSAGNTACEEPNSTTQL